MLLYLINGQVVILDTLTMSKEEDRSILQTPTICQAHDYDLMRPVVLATWKHGFQGSCPTQSPILAESQVPFIINQFLECSQNSIKNTNNAENPSKIP